VTEPLPQTTPEKQGVPSAAILDFVDAVDKQAAEKQVEGLHSLMLLRHGHTVAQGWWAPYSAQGRQLLFSVSKSFTSTAVGLAVSEGLLTVDDPVVRFFPAECPPTVSDNLADMTVRHLLTMTTGHAEDTVDRVARQVNDDWAKVFLAQPVDHRPGTTFVYNSGASYLLSAIVQRLTGKTLLDYLGPRLFAPLGITDPTWESCPHGVNTGGWGLSLRTRDIARFGQLHLDGGRWQGRQVVPRAWVDQATAWQVPNSHDAGVDWHQGYGYQFWRCRHDAYRGDGAFGQFCLVLPDRDAVLAITAGLADMQGVLDQVWEYLLPAMADKPLPADPTGHAALTERLAALTVPTVAGGQAGPASGRRYTVVDQPPDPEPRSPMDFSGLPRVGQVTLTDRGDGWTLALDHRELRAGAGTWLAGEFELAPGRRIPVAVSGAWTGPHTFELRACLVETPFIRVFTCDVAGDELTVRVRDNVSFTTVDHPTIVARASA
jgi:CubicO group peptidase (beta-lactamase class C family)